MWLFTMVVPKWGKKRKPLSWFLYLVRGMRVGVGNAELSAHVNFPGGFLCPYITCITWRAHSRAFSPSSFCSLTHPSSDIHLFCVYHLSGSVRGASTSGVGIWWHFIVPDVVHTLIISMSLFYMGHTRAQTHVYLQCVTWDSRTGPLRWAISEICEVAAWEAQHGVGCAELAAWSLEAVESAGTEEWRCRHVEAPRGALMCWGWCMRGCVGCVCSKCWAAGRGGEAYVHTTMERSEGRENTEQWLLWHHPTFIK